MSSKRENTMYNLYFVSMVFFNSQAVAEKINMNFTQQLCLSNLESMKLLQTRCKHVEYRNECSPSSPRPVKPTFCLFCKLTDHLNRHDNQIVYRMVFDGRHKSCCL